jgi:hypothetical protein
LPLGLLSLAGLACGGTAARPAPLDAAAEAHDPEDAGSATTADAAPADPMLDTVMIRPGGERTLQHMDCVVNAAGDGMALWRETDFDGKHQVWASHLSRERREWQSAELVGARPATDLDRLAVTLDAGGQALAVWNELDGPQAGVVWSRFLPATGWAPVQRIAAGWVLSMVGSAAGDAVAFGVVEGTPPTLLRYAPGVGWTLDSTLRLERTGFFFASPVGRGILAWNQPAGAGAELLASEYGPAGNWSQLLRMQEVRPFDHPFPMINATLAADGAGLLVWNRGGELQGELWASARSAPGTWEAPHRLEDGEAALWTTTVLVQEGGDGLVTWETGSPPRRKIWAALRAQGQWQPSVMLGEGSEFVTGALAPSGSAVVAWSTPRRVYGRRYTPAGGWGAPLLALGDNGGVADLCAGIDARGRGWIIWISGSPQVLRAAPIGD